MTKYSGMTDTGIYGRSRQEGELTSKIEKTTARMPSITFLSLAGAAAAGSIVLMLTGRRPAANDWAHLLGALVPSFLIMGLYNKLVKEHEPVGGDLGETRH